ncbi:MAG: DUF3601 domain-containing protein [Acidobacteria bacterium]|nr:DUF3601 domain-containing protein [Acidobacteriota bacterium]
MFDLTNLEGQVDHLSRDTRYRVLQPFVDSNGSAHEAGEEFRYHGPHVNLIDKRMKLRVEQNGQRTEWVFEFATGDGPRPGNLKRYFEEIPYESLPLEVREAEFAAEVARREAEEARRDAERTPDPSPASPGKAPLEEVYAAAVAGDLERAEALLKTIDDGRMLGDYHFEKLGSWLLDAAESAGSKRSPGARWLARKAVDQWWSWAAGSTSGGEGAARSYEVKQIEKRLKDYL